MPLGSLSVHYDCSDASSLFQDSGGTGAVSAADDPIGRLGDLSGNGRHATASGSARPTYQPSVQGGLAIARGNGINDAGLMTVMDVPVAVMPAGPCTVTAVVVVRGTRSVGNNRIFHTRSATGGHVNFGIRSRVDGVASGYGWLQAVVGDSTSATTLALDTYGTCVLPIGRAAILTVIVGDNSHGPRLRKDDGPEILAEDAYTANFAYTWASLFARKETGNPVEPGQFDLCEFMIRSGVPDDTEEYRETIWTPLRAKWDTPAKPTRSFSGWAQAGFDAIAGRIGQVGDPGHAVPSCIIERWTGGAIDSRKRPHPLVREFDRPLGGDGNTTGEWNGATPINRPCHNVDRAFGWYRLGLALGGSRATAVEAALDEVIAQARAAPRKLLSGGEHLTLALTTTGAVNGYGGQPAPLASVGGNHLAFERFGGRYNLDTFLTRPNGTASLIETSDSVWDHGLTGKAAIGSLDGNRHIPAVTGTQSVQGNVYPRLIGEYCWMWAVAYQSTGDSKYLDRINFVLDHAMITGTAPGTSPNFVRRHATTRALNFASGGSQIEGVDRNLVTPSNQIAIMSSYFDAAIALGTLPAPVVAKMVELRDEQDQVMLGFPHDLTLGGGGMAVRARWDDLDTQVGPFAGTYAGDHAPDEANLAINYLDRANAARGRGDSSTAAQLHAVAKASADRYLDAGPPAPGTIAMPMGFSAAIELLLGVHAVEGDSAYLDGAEAIGHRLVEEMFDADSDLPRAGVNSAYYETTAGNTEGLFALHELAGATASTPGARRRRRRRRGGARAAAAAQIAAVQLFRRGG